MNKYRQREVDAIAEELSTARRMTAARRNDLCDVLDQLIEAEEKAIAKMTPHREKGNTASNLNKAERAREALGVAQKSLQAGNTAAAFKALDSLAGMTASEPRKPTFSTTYEDDNDEHVVWPGDKEEDRPRTNPERDWHAEGYERYKEWQRIEHEKKAMRSPAFLAWLKKQGDPDLYDHLNKPHREHLLNTRREGSSNRPEDYEIILDEDYI